MSQPYKHSPPLPWLRGHWALLCDQLRRQTGWCRMSWASLPLWERQACLWLTVHPWWWLLKHSHCLKCQREREREREGWHRNLYSTNHSCLLFIHLFASLSPRVNSEKADIIVDSPNSTSALYSPIYIIAIVVLLIVFAYFCCCLITVMFLLLFMLSSVSL